MMESGDIQRFCWERSAYDEAVRRGAFGEDCHVQLLEGELYTMKTEDPAHAYLVDQVHEQLRRWYGEDFLVRVRAPFAASDRSEPEPDLYVVPGRSREYRTRHPDHAVLVVEVARTSLSLDRTTKARIYADAGVPEYWVINLEGQTVEVHRSPSNGAYAATAAYSGRQTILPLNRPGPALAVESLFD